MKHYRYSFAVMGCPGTFQLYAPSFERAEAVQTAVLALLARYECARHGTYFMGESPRPGGELKD